MTASPFFVTCTGVDDRTDPRALLALSDEFPRVEFAVLLSTARQGTPAYPGREWIEALLRIAGPRPLRGWAIHVCGRVVRTILEGSREFDPLLGAFGRVQFNFRVRQDDERRWFALLGRFMERTIIYQHNDANRGLEDVARCHRNAAALFDDSAGRGLMRTHWPAPLSGIECGYCGGIGPDNIATLLPRIHAVAGGRSYWIDMQSRLRDEHDAFDLGRVRECLVAVDRFVAGVTASGARAPAGP